MPCILHFQNRPTMTHPPPNYGSSYPGPYQPGYPSYSGPVQQVASQTTSNPSYYSPSPPATYPGYPPASHTFPQSPVWIPLPHPSIPRRRTYPENPPATDSLDYTTIQVPPTDSDWDWVNPDSWIDGQSGVKKLASHGSTEVWKVPRTTKCQF
jgi:hypothetical protein